MENVSFYWTKHINPATSLLDRGNCYRSFNMIYTRLIYYKNKWLPRIFLVAVTFGFFEFKLDSTSKRELMYIYFINY